MSDCVLSRNCLQSSFGVKISLALENYLRLSSRPVYLVTYVKGRLVQVEKEKGCTHPEFVCLMLKVYSYVYSCGILLLLAYIAVKCLRWYYQVSIEPPPANLELERRNKQKWELEKQIKILIEKRDSVIKIFQESPEGTWMDQPGPLRRVNYLTKNLIRLISNYSEIFYCVNIFNGKSPAAIVADVISKLSGRERLLFVSENDYYAHLTSIAFKVHSLKLTRLEKEELIQKGFTETSFKAILEEMKKTNAKEGDINFIKAFLEGYYQAEREEIKLVALRKLSCFHYGFIALT